jgi:hypothetical protein
MATLTQTHESVLNTFRGLPYIEQMKLLRSLMDEVVSHVVDTDEPIYSQSFVEKIRQGEVELKVGGGLRFNEVEFEKLRETI